MGLFNTINAFMADHRRRRRWLVLFPAELDAGSGPRPVDVVNVSTTGAMLYCDNPPQLNAHVALLWDDRRDPAEVMWVQGRRCGVRFAEPVPEAALERVSGGNWPR